MVRRQRSAPDRGAALAPEEGARETSYNRERLLALSDGVFAIALTLLVLELVPHVAEEVRGGALIEALLELVPELVAYLLSFLVIGRFWDTHRAYFRVIHLADTRVVWANLVVLLCVTLVPATAALLGTHWQEPAALVLYAVNLLLATGALWGLWRYAAAAGGLSGPGRQPQSGGYVDRFTAIAVTGYALAVPAAFLNPPMALGLVFLTTTLARTLARRRAPAP
jgi:uncharacterized membrane protein